MKEVKPRNKVVFSRSWGVISKTTHAMHHVYLFNGAGWLEWGLGFRSLKRAQRYLQSRRPKK